MLGTDPSIGIGTNDINAYFLFVYFSSRGKKNRSKDVAGKDVSELWKTKPKSKPAVKRECKWQAPTLIRRAVGFGNQIEPFKTQSDVPFLKQYGAWRPKFKISKFLLFRGGKERIFWSELQTVENKIDTRGLTTGTALSVDPNGKYPCKRWEGFHIGLAEVWSHSQWILSGIGIRNHSRRTSPSVEPLLQNPTFKTH